MKISSIPWLAPQNSRSGSGSGLSRSDVEKRKEIFLEVVYYVFDSLLIPLIRSNFHVTESNKHGNRLFYFRHDVWKAHTEPSLTRIKLTMFEDMETQKAKTILDARALGYSQIRLIPKSSGVRPITNLRRRVSRLQNGHVSLGRSINSLMGPVFNALTYEKKQQSHRLGSALFSVGDIYSRLRAYRNRNGSSGLGKSAFYFVKVDVTSCFDTIPQRRVMHLIEQIASKAEYRIARHVEIKMSNVLGAKDGQKIDHRPTRKFLANASAADDFSTFLDLLADGIGSRHTKTVFVDSVVQTVENREKLLDLLEEHIERNIVKIGKKFFRQKTGVPQGSILSSLLCNFFYAEFEKECLGFLSNPESLLLRLIDDFLLITTDKRQAEMFMQTMHQGNEKYGIQVNHDKTLTNFNSKKLEKHHTTLMQGKEFPYCGNIINTTTLELSKDRDRRKANCEPLP